MSDFLTGLGAWAPAANVASFVIAAGSAVVAVVAWVRSREARQRADQALESVAVALDRGFPEILAHARFEFKRSGQREAGLTNLGAVHAHQIRLESSGADLNSFILGPKTFDLRPGEACSIIMTVSALASLRAVTVSWIEDGSVDRRSQQVLLD